MMESKCKIASLIGDTLVIVLNGANRHELETLKQDKDYRIKLTRWAEKRSLNANAYFHVLVGKIADKLHESKPYIKNLLISRYGQQETYERDGVEEVVFITTSLPESVMMEREDIHCMPCKYLSDTITEYKVFRGSHTYSTKEMQVLIDGAVSEAKELGIETLSPAELQRMKEQWGI